MNNRTNQAQCSEKKGQVTLQVNSSQGYHKVLPLVPIYTWEKRLWSAVSRLRKQHENAEATLPLKQLLTIMCNNHYTSNTVFNVILLAVLQIKSGFSEGLKTALDDYKQDGFKQAWDGLQSKV